ncbi:MAG: HNH endonuclease [Lachnospiraceae bacterium]|nr:HNH endonuclease [Lachnospiraceae bacterium]
MATSHIPANYGIAFQAFIAQQKALYKQYSGCLLGYGIIASVPEQDLGWWMADIHQLKMFSRPVHIDEFKSFIAISKRGSITYLKPEQWDRLKWLVNQKNPGTFQNVTPPDAKDLEKDFLFAVHKESSKSLSSLKKAAEKKSTRATASAVNTTVYHRNPTIAAYVKKRAAGFCQLCGKKAPFNDPYGEPYLECHHINWLSKGGMDSVNNCVALCPNCHRKMHIINDPNDIRTLKEVISSIE